MNANLLVFSESSNGGRGLPERVDLRISIRGGVGQGWVCWMSERPWVRSWCLVWADEEVKRAPARSPIECTSVAPSWLQTPRLQLSKWDAQNIPLVARPLFVHRTPLLSSRHTHWDTQTFSFPLPCFFSPLWVFPPVWFEGIFCSTIVAEVINVRFPLDLVISQPSCGGREKK